MVDCSAEETLTEEREDLIINPCSEKPSWRIAHFLKPSLPTLKQPQNLQTHLKPKKPITPNIKSLNSTVNFHGWKRPLEKWGLWVQKLLPSYESTWKKTSLYEPIMASTFEIPRCQDTIYALAERWCPETSSFLLNWGEITITLEDIMVLGGYSVLGDSVLGSENSEEMQEIGKDLDRVRREIMKTKAKRADQQQWMNIWMGKESKFEHEAFLSLWLSRYVMPSDSVCTIHKSVFPVAIRLAKGIKIALGPGILGRIYRDLRLLNEKIETFGVENEGVNMKKLNLWAPLQLLQIWVWERFPKLSPVPNVTINGQPRLAKWHKVKILRKNNVGLDIDSAKESFQWRPYSSSLNKSSLLAKFYQENASWVSVSSSAFDLDLQSYVRFIRASYLIGIDKDCIERYLPHRVSMQFGLDQDIPGDLPPLSNSNCEIAWNNYNRPIKDVKLYVPSRFCESGVTKRYLEWWKNSNSTKEDEKNSAVNMSEKMRIKLENNEAEVPPGFEPKGKRIRLEGDDDHDNLTLSQFRLKHMNEKRIKLEGDDDHDDNDDDDNLTLSQFRLTHMNRANENGVFSVTCSETPISSAGENECIRDEENIGITEQREHTSREFLVEDGTQNEAENLNKSSTKIIKKKYDLLAKISRLERIVDMIKMAQIIQP